MSVFERKMRIIEAGHSLYKPYLDVVYINPHTGKHLNAIALIDTGGADYCIVPASYAEILGHNLELGEESEVVGISNTSVSLYKHTMQIKIAGSDFITNEIQIGFSSNSYKNPILGVKTFLSNFVLTVNYPNQTFSLILPNIEDNLSKWSTP